MLICDSLALRLGAAMTDGILFRTSSQDLGSANDGIVTETQKVSYVHGLGCTFSWLDVRKDALIIQLTSTILVILSLLHTLVESRSQSCGTEKKIYGKALCRQPYQVSCPICGVISNMFSCCGHRLPFWQAACDFRRCLTFYILLHQNRLW